ncbi:hypothetical protein RC859_001363 [Vibrio alginolyticus]|nr:hypothetical protein [Vibrio alginolyticus]
MDKKEITRVNTLIQYQDDLISAYQLYVDYVDYVESGESERMIDLARNEIMAKHMVLKDFKVRHLAKKLME